MKKVNEDGSVIYVCECGKEFEKRNQFIGHCGHCEKHLGYKSKFISPFALGKGTKSKEGGWDCPFCNQNFRTRAELTQHKKDAHPEKMINGCAWSKGLTKETDKRVAKASITRKKSYKDGKWNQNGINNGFYGKKHSEESRQKMSETRKRKIASGEIILSPLSGKTHHCGIYYKNKLYKFRSTYEFIFALALCHNNINFEYESIKIPNTFSNKPKTFICDFYIPDKNLIIETKGRKSIKDIWLNKSFTKNNYNFVELFDNSIQNIKNFLSINNYPIEDMLKNIHKYYKQKKYYIFNFDNKTEDILDIQKQKILKKLLGILKITLKYKINLDKILDTNIDLTQYGWLSKILKMDIGLSHKQIIKTLNYFHINYYKLSDAEISDKDNEDYLKSGPHYCEKCGQLIEKKFGSGRFCSKACANSRIHTEEQKQKISNSLRKHKI